MSYQQRQSCSDEQIKVVPLQYKLDKMASPFTEYIINTQNKL